MSSPHDEKMVTICLPDIRTELEKIEDKQLSLKILDSLEAADKILAEKIAIIAEMTARNDSLLEANNKLFSRVSSFVDRDPPSKTTDYTEMDNKKFNELLNRI